MSLFPISSTLVEALKSNWRCWVSVAAASGVIVRNQQLLIVWVTWRMNSRTVPLLVLLCLPHVSHMWRTQKIFIPCFYSKVYCRDTEESILQTRRCNYTSLSKGQNLLAALFRFFLCSRFTLSPVKCRSPFSNQCRKYDTDIYIAIKSGRTLADELS